MTAFHAEIPLKGFMKIMFEKWISEEKHFMFLILLFKPISIPPTPRIEFLSTVIQPPLLGRQFSKCGSAECFLGGCPCRNLALEQTDPFQTTSWSLTELRCRLYPSDWAPVNSSRTEEIRTLSEKPPLWWMGFSLVLFLRQDFTMWFWLAYVGRANSNSDNCLFCLQTKTCTTTVGENLVSKWPL